MAGGCPNGAVVRPGYGLVNVAIDLVIAGLGAVTGLEELAPWLFANPILATIATNALCASNPVDAGDFNISMLAVPPGVGEIPNALSTPGSFNRWLYDKAYYYAFSQACQCADTSLPPPAASPVTPPGPHDPTTTLPDHGDQLRRIEQHQLTSDDALRQLYNGMQLGVTEMRDNAFRQRSSAILTSGSPSWQIVGEGQHQLDEYTQFGGGATQDVFGIVVHLDQIPPTVARRGTTYQRLYGVGSIEWNAEVQLSSPHTIAQRDALHYERQFIQAPQHAQVWTVRWRLQPGVVGTAYQIFRNPDSAIYAPYAPYDGAYQRFDNWNAPPNWVDEPIYPTSTRRTFVLGGGALPP